MAIQAPLMIMLLASMVSPHIGSCPENTAAMFCNGASFAPQVYCSNVNPNDYPCTKKHNVWCGCSDGFARAKDNACVPISECNTKSDVRAISLGTSAESEGNQGESDVQRTGSKLTQRGETVLKFLEDTEEIYLTQISTQVEKKDDCACLKSAFLTNAGDGVERTLRCYYYVRSQAAYGSRAQVRDGQRLITRTEYAKFQVSTKGTETVIIVDYAELASDVTHLNKQELYLRGEFIVLEAESDCLLIELGKESDGGSICLFWTSAPSANKQHNCLNAPEKCRKPMKELTAHIEECNKHDVSVKRANDRENEELLSSESSHK